MAQEQIDSAVIPFTHVSGKPISGKFIAPVVIGCIDYRFAFNPEQHHQTAFAFHVFRYDPAEPTHGLAINAQESLPISSMWLEPYFFSGGHAD